MSNEFIEICSRCFTTVSFEEITDGYYAYCPRHDEDLYSFEIKRIGKLS
jgi:uncharacterized paraquat-inducible protein A